MRHCDDAIHNHKLPLCVRYFILVNRMPACDKCIVVEKHGEPVCFATHNGKRVRLVMASRMGDIGITKKLKHDTGYSKRVSIDDLSDFSDTAKIKPTPAG